MKFIANLAAVAASLFLLSAQAPTDVPEPVPKPERETITLRINCGQGIVDQPHRITYKVKKTDEEGNVTEHEVQIQVPSSASTEGAALSTETAMETAGLGDVDTGESGNDPKQEEDVTLPEGVELCSVTVEKKVGNTWKKNDGHLEVLNSDGDNISN